jgi:YD repeat-containing protein
MRILLLVFSLCLSAAYAQVLDNRMGEAFTDKPFFNEDFVKRNRLKRLNGTYTYKNQGGPMRETKFKHVYEFDREGRLILTYETRTDDGTKDTSWNIYEYDEYGFLDLHRKTDEDGFTSVRYTNDSIGRIIKEEYVREIDSNGRLVRTLTFNEERFVYAEFENQTKCTHYNNYDLPYLDEICNYNELGYLVSREERIKMTSSVYTYTHEYNDKGKLAAIKKTSNRKSGILEEMTFKYDELGNLIEKRIYRDGEFTTDIQIIYNSKTKLLSAVLTKQVSTGFMTIVRFKDYEFY